MLGSAPGEARFWLQRGFRDLARWLLTLAPGRPMTFEDRMSEDHRDSWNAEAVLMALQPWELDVIERGLTCLAALATTHPEWDHVRGQEARALAVVDKLNQVVEYQGYAGGIAGVRKHLRDSHM